MFILFPTPSTPSTFVRRVVPSVNAEGQVGTQSLCTGARVCPQSFQYQYNVCIINITAECFDDRTLARA